MTLTMQYEYIYYSFRCGHFVAQHVSVSSFCVATSLFRQINNNTLCVSRWPSITNTSFDIEYVNINACVFHVHHCPVLFSWIYWASAIVEAQWFSHSRKYMCVCLCVCVCMSTLQTIKTTPNLFMTGGFWSGSSHLDGFWFLHSPCSVCRRVYFVLHAYVYNGFARIANVTVIILRMLSMKSYCGSSTPHFVLRANCKQEQ